jgi:hypothetical protein
MGYGVGTNHGYHYHICSNFLADRIFPDFLSLPRENSWSSGHEDDKEKEEEDEDSEDFHHEPAVGGHRLEVPETVIMLGYYAYAIFLLWHTAQKKIFFPFC